MINAKKLNKEDKMMIEVGIKAAARALLTAHNMGLIRIPCGATNELTAEELESKLTTVANSAIAKIEELDPNA